MLPNQRSGLVTFQEAEAFILAAAALLLLGEDTNQLFSAGFQMSFSIVAAIFLLSPPLQEFFSARLRPDPFLPRRLYTRRQQITSDAGHELASTLGVSCAAWLGSLPLTIAVFHLLPLLAIPANMLSVPLAFAILAVSMLALVTGAVSLWLAAVFNNASWGLATLLIGVVEGTAALPGSYLPFPPGWMQPAAQITVFDLGNGGAQLVRTREQAWLLDTGSESDFRRIIEPSLRTAGITRLDALVVTHGDADHLGGVEVDAGADGFHVGGAFRALAGFQGTPDGRHGQGGQNSDDGDDHQQLDQSKSTMRISRISKRSAHSLVLA